MEPDGQMDLYMTQLKISKILKTVLTVSLLVLCGLLAWALIIFILHTSLPWWAKATILTGLAATIIIIVLLRKLWLKRKEMRFIDGIIGPDNRIGNISSLDDASRQLRRRFKHAVAVLKKSHLRKNGNPLYALPWYLIVGKSGSGKSTAIKSARLPSPFGDTNRISGLEGTRNCDWWFFDDSVVIDIAGRYSVYRDEELDKAEWLTFLHHLVKYRKKEPINGIIVTVEAQELLELDSGKIEDEGRTIRQRIDEVIHVMGARFPIYVLVTKCDLVYGMGRFCELIPDNSLDQAMGLMNHDGESDIVVLANRTMDIIVDKLKDIRLILCNNEKVKDKHYVEPQVLLFPDEIARLRKGLIAFCKGALNNNPFQELPMVRGIYFSSGRQGGRPAASQAARIGNIETPDLPGTSHGYFLHDFFAKILPADRSLYRPTRRARQWHRITRNIWLTGFVAVIMIFCIFLTHSWIENRSIIQIVSPQYKKNIIFQNDPVIDIGIMDQFSRQIKAIEQKNLEWKTPRLGLTASLSLEKELKKRYCKRFFEHFDSGIHSRIEKHIANGGWKQNNYEPAINYIPFIVRRINMLKALFDGADAAMLRKLPDPNYALMISADNKQPIFNELMNQYKNAYIHYLIWQTDVEKLNITHSNMQRLLRNYFHEEQGDLRWLVTWADRQIHDKKITLNHFWQSRISDDNLVAIAPSITLEGRKLIGDFVVHELDTAVEQPLWLAKPREQFAGWYKDAYYGGWMAFCIDFGKGWTLFKTPDERQGIVSRLVRSDSPYFELIKTMEDHLVRVSDEDAWPGLKLESDLEQDKNYRNWLSRIKQFNIIGHAVDSDAVADNKAVAQLTRRVSSRGRLAGQIAQGILEKTDLAKGKEAFTQYKTALEGFSGIESSYSHAYTIAKTTFEDDPAQARSPLLATQKAIKHLADTISHNKRPIEGKQTSPFWSLLTEPVNYLWQYCVAQAGCHLQQLWDQEVIVKTDGVYNQHQLASLLFGDQGIADQYIHTYAWPFIRHNSRRGYHVRNLGGCRIHFRNSFFEFYKQGKRYAAAAGEQIQEQVVEVMAKPTDVNAEAKLRPHMTRLSLDDAQGVQVLENRHYSIGKKFIWSSAKSGSVTLEIMFENLLLVRKYAGYCAFGKFLNDFRTGRKIFFVTDFPESAADLNRLGVTQIEVTYEFQPQQTEPIIRLLRSTPGGPPKRIVTCNNWMEDSR